MLQKKSFCFHFDGKRINYLALILFTASKLMYFRTHSKLETVHHLLNESYCSVTSQLNTIGSQTDSKGESKVKFMIKSSSIAPKFVFEPEIEPEYEPDDEPKAGPEVGPEARPGDGPDVVPEDGL